ncbi:MAG: hypothetical protein AAB386_01705 [Patescibacteria group bacterium]
MKTIVKTRTSTSTSTRVAIATAAVLMLGLAAYGLGYGFMPKFSPVPSAVRSTAPSPSSGGAQTATSPTPGANKVGLFPKNKPKITASGIQSAGYGYTKVGDMHSKKNIKLYGFKIEPTLDPLQFGVIQVRQLVFNVRMTAGVKMHSVYLADKDGKLIHGMSVVAVRKSSPNKLFDLTETAPDVSDSNESITSYPEGGKQMDEFDVIVSGPGLTELKPEGIQATLRGKVDGSEVNKSSVISVMVDMYATGIEPPYGGYIVHQRKYAQNPANVLAVTPASVSVLYLLIADSPVDTEPKNVRPDYLHWCPTIWSDSSAKNHSSIIKVSKDWFCLNGLLGTMYLSES